MSAAQSAIRESEYADEYRQLAPRGVRYAYSLLRNAADSEEMVQEAFCRLLRSNKSPSQLNGSFAPLFFTTVRNLCVDSRRAAGRRRQVSLEGLPYELPAVAADQPMELEEFVLGAVEALPGSWADALRLRMDGELSYDQIAEVLQCTRAQVRTWIFRARQQLANEFRKQGYLRVHERRGR